MSEIPKYIVLDNLFRLVGEGKNPVIVFYGKPYVYRKGTQDAFAWVESIKVWIK